MKISRCTKMFLLIALSCLTSLCFFSTLIQAQSKSTDNAKRFHFKSTPRVYSDDWVTEIQYYNKNFIDMKNIWVGLTFTEDGGQTWKRMIVTPAIAQLLGYEISDDNQDLVESDLRMIFFLHKKRGWLSPDIRGSDSIWQTEDSGYTWMKIFNEGCLEPPFFLNDKKHGWLFLKSKIGPNYIASTNDGGKTWSRHKANVPRDGLIHFPYFINRTTGYAVVSIFPDKEDQRGSINWIAKTTDSGRNWKLLWMSSNPYERYTGLQFINAKEGWIWSDAVYYTKDGGESWEKRVDISNLAAGSMYYVNRHKGWLLSWGIPDKSFDTDYRPSLFSTSDGGKTWKLFSIEQIINNPNLYFGPKPFFPNWNDGNMFLFWLKMEYLKK
jgi:photosystem II stability/assembly factor-like uncharacterized protein